MATTAAQLVGRARETRRLRRLLDRVPGGGGALVVRGEPGVGKSALLSAGEDGAEARGLTVLRTAGVRSEVDLPFAGLHQLIQPLAGGIEALPAAQRSAMLTAFGLAEGRAPDVFLIGPRDPRPADGRDRLLAPHGPRRGCALDGSLVLRRAVLRRPPDRVGPAGGV